MSLDARLKRVAPILTAKERGILVLGALKNKTPEEPAWRSTMPPSQTSEFNRLISLMNACNMYLPLYITAIELRVQQLHVCFSWWQSVLELGLQTWGLAELVPANRRAKAEKLVSTRYPEAELPWEREESKRSWLTLSDKLEKEVRLMLILLWQEVRGVEIVLDEVAMEFDGEDPLRPVMRDVLDTVKRKLTDLHELLSAIEPLELEEPDEEALDLARTYFRKGKDLMARI